MKAESKTEPLPSSDREMLHMAFGALKAITPGHPTTIRIEGYLFGGVLGADFGAEEISTEVEP